jgi:hypothetical protein
MKATFEERIVGYDAREFWRPFDWSEENRNRFLYRLDITKPLSVDVLIWQSIFVSESRRSPIKQFGFQSFWSDFTLLRKAITIAHSEQPFREYRMIAAVVVLGDYSKHNPINWNDRVPSVTPDQRGADWKLIGYDVADQWALSGLSDCGFVSGYDDVPALRQRWGPLLNKWHLFDDLDAAIEFKHKSDERMKSDHAPFFVYGLWLIK